MDLIPKPGSMSMGQQLLQNQALDVHQAQEKASVEGCYAYLQSFNATTATHGEQLAAAMCERDARMEQSATNEAVFIVWLLVMAFIWLRYDYIKVDWHEEFTDTRRKFWLCLVWVYTVLSTIGLLIYCLTG